MKIIYLIDDNQNNQRLTNYNITFIEEGVFDGLLTSIEKLEIGKNSFDISHLEFLKTASCILLHSTTEDYDINKGFLSGSITNALKIKETISQEGDIIPLVLFSNSMSDVKFDFESNPNYIPAIRKNLFYERLFDFLGHYKNTGNIELRIIAWGKNYQTREISRLAIEILSAFEQKDNTSILILSDLSRTIKDFESFVKLALPENDVKQILNGIEDSPMQVQDFKRKVIQITESYAKFGKNIYTWK